VNYEFDILDSYYNGTYSFTLTPPQGNSSCPTIESKQLTNQYIRIGPNSRDGHSREGYDKNPFYFQFGNYKSAGETRCAFAANKAFIGFQSSNDDLVITQPWNLDVPKLNSGSWELTGKMGQVEAGFGNYFHYAVNDTGADKGYPKTCNRQFTQHALTLLDEATMTGNVGVSDAKLDFSFTDSITGYAVKGSFEGKIWDKGPKLVMSGDNIMTTGKAKRIKAPESFSSRSKKIIIISVTLAAICLFVMCGWYCCCKAACCSRVRKPKPVELMNEPAWHH
jgi:hypothetical protein